ncbi:MAG: tetratricopeptide repeat protein [Rhizomicrobium sp.]
MSSTTMRHLFLIAVIVFAVGASARAATAPAGGKAQYDHCLARASSNANEALREAEEWQKAGGGPASDHCMAVALVALHRYGEAGAKLDALARGGFATDPTMRTALFDQAGNAWLLANKPDSAIASFSAALAIDPSDADLLSDRARASAMKKSWARAESDLSAALLVDPARADLLVLRGSARHAMGRKADARADYERALKLHPGFVDALVERGTMKFESGDTVGARVDWNQVVSTSPNSAAADVARQHLADTEATAPAPGNNGAVVLKPPKPR